MYYAIYIELFLTQMNSSRLNFTIYLVMLTLIILWQYPFIKMYFIETNKTLRFLHLIGCYINIIIVSICLFLVIGYGYAIYEMRGQGINASEALLNITENDRPVNVMFALIANAIDNLSSNVGIKVIKSDTSNLLNISNVIFSVISKVFVSIYEVLILSFVSSTLFSEKDVN